MKIFFFVSALFTKKNYESRLENSVLFICFSQWRPVEIVSVLLGGVSSKTENRLWGFQLGAKKIQRIETKMINELKVN